MKRILTLILLMFACVGQAQLTPIFRNLSVNTDGTLRGPTNFFESNQVLKGRRFATLSNALESNLGTNKISVWIDGLTALNDGFQGWFTFDPSASWATNRGIFFAPTNGVGRLIRNYDRITARQFGAKGDGVADDTANIQDALQFAYPTRGTVDLEEGIFVTTGITIPEFVRLRGLTQAGQKNPGEGTTQLKLKNGSNNAHVITITEECEVQGVQVDGNKANVTGTSYGIFVNRDKTYIESRLKDCVVVNAKTVGIYIDAHEITLEKVTVIESDGYGIYVDDAYDTMFRDVLCGWNGNDGVFFATGGSGTRITSLDCYYGRGNGVTFTDPDGVFVDRLQIDFNFRNGIEIVSNSGSAWIDIGLRFIYGSNVNDDGRGRTNSAASGTYSDIVVSGNNYPSHIMLRGGRVGSAISGLPKKPAYCLAWSNSVPDVGWGMSFQNVNMNTVNGTRVESGKSAPDGFLTKFHWNGRILNYYDGTNARVLVRDAFVAMAWDYLSPPIFTTVTNDLTISTNVIIKGGLRLGGASDGRRINSDNLGYQIKGTPGYPAIGLASQDQTAFVGTESLRARVQFDTVTGNSTLNSIADRTSGTDLPWGVSYTLNQASGTAGSTGFTVRGTTTAFGSGSHRLLNLIMDNADRFNVSTAGRIISIVTNGVAGHSFQSEITTNSRVSIVVGELSNSRATLGGNYLDFTTADGVTPIEVTINRNFATVGVGGLFRTASGIEYGPSGPRDLYGAGAPTGSFPNGSTYRRTDGSGPYFYVRENGAWVAK